MKKEKSLFKTIFGIWTAFSALICALFIAFSLFQKDIPALGRPEIVITVSVIIMALALLFPILFSRDIKRQNDEIINFFKLYADRKDAWLDEKKIHYQELKFIGASAISMVKEIETLIQTVKDLAIKSEIGNQARKNFLVQLNHEVRTPMTDILGMTEIFLDMNLEPAQRDYVTTIRNSGLRLMSFLEQINKFSFLDPTEYEVKIKNANLAKIITNVAEIYKLQADQKNIKFGLSIAEEIPELVKTDPDAVSEIISILLANAVQFTEKGSVSITFKMLKDISSSANFAIINVSDTGPGISVEKIDRIFDPSRDKAESAKNFGSVSLSLAVCRHIIAKLNGTISIESNKGKGTLFRVKIPVEIPNMDEKEQIISQKTESAEKIDKRLFGKIRALLVDDDAPNRKMAQLFLQKLGLQIETATNGKDAVEKFALGFFDIVFIDCEMPEMDGYDATRAIRKLEKGKSIPIIAVTANAFDSDKQKCLNAGMSDYISKPFKMDSLKQMLAKYCLQKQNTDQLFS